jgi:plasmid stability protein
MATITFKNIPEELYQQLKESAKANHRSVNGELIHCLEQLFSPRPLSAQAIEQSARALRDRVGAAKLDAEDITAAKHQGRA